MLVASAMLFVDFPWQARFLYLTPFNIYVAYGILWGGMCLLKFYEAVGRRFTAKIVFWMFYALAIMLLLNYAVRCVTIKQFGSVGLTISQE
mgnify:CR=1 FL=1